MTTNDLDGVIPEQPTCKQTGDDPPNDPANFPSYLFLDIDGVLNSHTYCREAASNLIDRDKVSHLNRILETTGAGLVISSAWRYLVHRGEMTLAGLDWLLRSHGVRAGHLCGITETDEVTSQRVGATIGMNRARAEQISYWAWQPKNGDDRPFVIIDDLDLGFTDRSLPFVQTDSSIGLTAIDADRAITLLGCNP